jgi:23S rRNA (uracil1939-C5)-methyltransferase
MRTVRGPPACPHRPPCPGCPRFGESGISGEARAALNRLASEHGLPPVDVVSGSTHGFRLRARLAIRGRQRSPKLGLFEADSHRVVTIPNCSVQHPLINHVSGVVRGALVDAAVPPYSEAAHQGFARYLQVVVERTSQTAQVVLVANSDTPDPLARCLDLIRERLGERLHSLWFNANCGRGNAILGPDFRLWSGQETVVERFGGAAVHYPPGAFGQSNLEISTRIIEHLREQIPYGARAVEFHAGVGAIGLSVLARTSTLVLNEVSPPSLQGLERGLADLEAADRARVRVVPGPAGDAHGIVEGADVVIVDPPRKGLEVALRDALRDHPPERLLYVSCSRESLQEDLAALIATGSLQLTGLKAFNLIPFTKHIETVARLEPPSATNPEKIASGANPDS